MTTAIALSGGSYGLGTINRRMDGILYHGHGGSILHYSAMDYSTQSNFGCVAISIDASKTNQSLVHDALIKVVEARIADAPDPTLGFSEADKDNSFQVFPNPASDFIQIRSESVGISKVRVRQLNGQVVLDKELDLSSSQLDVSALENGLYMLHIVGLEGKQIFGKRLLIAK